MTKSVVDNRIGCWYARTLTRSLKNEVLLWLEPTSTRRAETLTNNLSTLFPHPLPAPSASEKELHHGLFRDRWVFRVRGIFNHWLSLACRADAMSTQPVNALFPINLQLFTIILPSVPCGSVSTPPNKEMNKEIHSFGPNPYSFFVASNEFLSPTLLPCRSNEGPIEPCKQCLSYPILSLLRNWIGSRAGRRGGMIGWPIPESQCNNQRFRFCLLLSDTVHQQALESVSLNTAPWDGRDGRERCNL